MDIFKEDERLCVFDYNKWHEKILFSPLSLSEISGYVKEKDLVSEYISRKEVETDSAKKSYSTKVSELPYKERSFYESFIKGDLEIAVKILSRQMVVLAATYIEGIIYEFLLLIFSKHPDRMYDYLGQDISKKGKGKVALHEIIHATSKEDLIYTLAERASRQATLGNFSIYKRRIKKISNCDLSEDIGEIIDLRNKLVHETEEPDISVDEVIDTFQILEKMLYEIGKKAKENGIEIKGDFDQISEPF